jgi:hypothetical protein
VADQPEDFDTMSAEAVADVAMQSRRASQTAAEPHLARLGRACASLHDTHGWSWPQIGRWMDVNASTAWRWASPYLRD